MPWLAPINNLFQVSGIYLIMAVSIDRLVIVRKQVKPTIGNRRRRKLLTWLVIFVIFLFSFLFTLPNWFLYESIPHEINITYHDLDFNRQILEFSKFFSLISSIFFQIVIIKLFIWIFIFNLDQIINQKQIKNLCLQNSSLIFYLLSNFFIYRNIQLLDYKVFINH